MPRKGWRKPRPEVGNPSDPAGMAAAQDKYIDYLKVTNFSEHTVELRWRHLYNFIAWCDERSISRPEEVTKADLERYRRHLYHYRKQNGHVIGPKTRASHLISLRVFFKWLSRADHIP